MVEILKNVSQEVIVLVLDEPTTALSSKEVEDLFKMLQKLKDKGVCIIYISHKIDEVLRISDKISVLRDGILVGTVDKSKTTREEIIEMMIGRDITWEVKTQSEVEDDAPVVLNVKEIQSNKLKDIAFDLKNELIDLGVKDFRLDFTVEDYKETASILKAYKATFIDNEPFTFKEDYTKGHLKRGVE